MRGKLVTMHAELDRIQAASAPKDTVQKLEKAEAACTAKDSIIVSLRCVPQHRCRDGDMPLVCITREAVLVVHLAHALPCVCVGVRMHAGQTSLSSRRQR